jgi:hypothetical protein
MYFVFVLVCLFVAHGLGQHTSREYCLGDLQWQGHRNVTISGKKLELVGNVFLADIGEFAEEKSFILPELH